MCIKLNVTTFDDPGCDTKLSNCGLVNNCNGLRDMSLIFPNIIIWNWSTLSVIFIYTFVIAYTATLPL